MDQLHSDFATFPLADCVNADKRADTSNLGRNLVHRPLQHGHIRLLQILPGDLSDNLCCLLESSALDEYPVFTALSYTWGSEPSEHSIWINGVRLNIRKNLWRFLSQARAANMRDRLWIDAICIEQGHGVEKMEQIKLMPCIYSSATKVVVWLGQAYADSDQAMRELRKASWPTNRLNRVWSKPGGVALQLLCSRPYWKRLWIFQELVLAKSAEIMCGCQVIPFDNLGVFLLKVDRVLPGPRLQEKQSFESVRSSTALSIVRKITTKQDRTLWELLIATRYLRCAENKDKVFALLGIANAGHENISPDYETSMPVLLNTVLRNYHNIRLPESTSEVREQCGLLTQILNVDEASIFILDPTPEESHDTPIWQKDGLTLAWASHYNHSAISDLLHTSNAIPIDTVEHQITRGNLPAIRLLIKTGRRHIHWYPLFSLVLKTCQLELANLLLASDLPNVTATHSSCLALHLAAAGGHEGMVALILDAGADANAERCSAGNALYPACTRGHLRVAEMLLERGADVNMEGGYHSYPLLAALDGGHVELAKFLLSRGADPHVRWRFNGENDGQTALYMAAGRGYTEIVGLLLGMGVELDVKVGRKRMTALQNAISMGEEYERIVGMLIKAGADVNNEGGDNGTPLLDATAGGLVNLARMLLDAGADVDARGGEPGGTALEMARLHESKGLVRLLLEYGASTEGYGVGAFAEYGVR